MVSKLEFLTKLQKSDDTRMAVAVIALRGAILAVGLRTRELGGMCHLQGRINILGNPSGVILRVGVPQRGIST